MTQAFEVETRLREMILTMELGPGEPLSERWGEATFHASRTPVRAALLRLLAEGLVCRDGRGWRVSPINLTEIDQLFVYREVLEVAAIRRSVGSIDAGRLADIEALLDHCGADATREETHRVGLEFHVALARLAGNEFITRGIADAMNRLSRARWLESDPTHPGWREHRAVLAALRAGRESEAIGLVEAHVRETRKRVLAALRESRRSLRARGVDITE